jgi:hypothetical protein
MKNVCLHQGRGRLLDRDLGAGAAEEPRALRATKRRQIFCMPRSGAASFSIFRCHPPQRTSRSEGRNYSISILGTSIGYGALRGKHGQNWGKTYYV